MSVALIHPDETSFVAKKRKKPGRKPLPAGTRKDESIQFRMTAAFKAHLEEFCLSRSPRASLTALIEDALLEYLKARKFPFPPLHPLEDSPPQE